MIEVNCSVCHHGELHEQVVETWIKRETRWVMVRLRAHVCDECGREIFDRDGAEILSRLSDPNNHQVPTEFLSAPVFDTTAPRREPHPPAETSTVAKPLMPRVENLPPAAVTSATTVGSR